MSISDRDQNVQVRIVGPHDTSIAVWEGPIPQNDDRLKVVKTGSNIAEPGERAGTVIGREWLHTHQAEIGERRSRIQTVCFVKVRWDVEGES